MDASVAPGRVLVAHGVVGDRISVGAAWFILGEALIGTFWDGLTDWGPRAVTNALAVGGAGGRARWRELHR